MEAQIKTEKSQILAQVIFKFRSLMKKFLIDCAFLRKEEKKKS